MIHVQSFSSLQRVHLAWLRDEAPELLCGWHLSGWLQVPDTETVTCKLCILRQGRLP